MLIVAIEFPPEDPVPGALKFLSLTMHIILDKKGRGQERVLLNFKSSPCSMGERRADRLLMRQRGKGETRGLRNGGQEMTG